MTGVQTNDTAYEILFSDWSSDVCSSDPAAGGYVTVGDKVIAHHVYGQNLLQKVLDTVGDNNTGLIFQTKDKSITNHKWANKFISAFSKQFDIDRKSVV